MNILITTIVDEYMDDWIADMLERLKVEQCIVVYGNISQNGKKVQEGRVCTKYATCKISYIDTTTAEYEYLKMNNIPPADESLLNAMAPYEDVIFWMLRRRLGRAFTRIWRGYCEHIRLWNYLLEKYHVDVYLSAGIPHEGFAYIIYALCKIKGIKFIGSFYAHFNEYSYLFYDICNPIPEFESYFKSLQKKYNDFTTEEIVLANYLDSYYRFYFDKQSDLTPWYVDKNTAVLNTWSAFVQWITKCRRRIKMILNRLNFLVKRLIFVGSLNLRIYESTMRHFGFKDVFLEYEMLAHYYKENTRPVDYTQKYIYVALHMQPEATSSPMGGRYVDQLLMIQMLSSCLPEGYVLYVKEHPGQYKNEMVEYPFRTLQFYQELLKIPKVYLVSVEEDTYKLIKGSRAVASLTGTVGFEAIIYNKLFLMFGYYITQYAPNVFPIRSVADCLAAMNKIEVYEPEEADTQKQIKIYFKTLEKYLFKGLPYDDPEMNKIVSKNYWDESKRNVSKAFLAKIVELMGESVLK